MHRGRLKPKFRQPSTWLVSPELCARSRYRAAKHAAGRQRDAWVWAVKRYHQTFVESLKKARCMLHWSIRRGVIRLICVHYFVICRGEIVV